MSPTSYRVMGVHWALLLLGDGVCFLGALFLALFIRGSSAELLIVYPVSFLLLIALSIAVLFVAGLYDSKLSLFRGRVPRMLLGAQVASAVIATGLFYFVPTLGIAPKTVLFLYILLSTTLLLLWRLRVQYLLRKRTRTPVWFLASPALTKALEEAVGGNPTYPFTVAASADPESPGAAAFLEAYGHEHAAMLAVEYTNPRVEELLARTSVASTTMLDATQIYEEVFGRVFLPSLAPLSIRTIARSDSSVYVHAKRVLDVCVAFPLFLLSLLAYPFIVAAIKLQDGGSAFITQERVGQDGQIIRLYKFRSMSGDDAGKYGKEGTSTLTVTSIGRLLRVTRLDELPQLWNVLRGELSLVGPRPELPALVVSYERDIPFYRARLTVPPGLSGWAQLYQENHPHHGLAIAQTAEKLSYDLYYLKHRSLWLDISIMARTITVLLSRTGS